MLRLNVNTLSGTPVDPFLSSSTINYRNKSAATAFVNVLNAFIVHTVCVSAAMDLKFS